MLANLLAVVVGLSSLGFYLIAFVLPEVHRRSDFFWSGVGMFYAIVLWYCARQMQGAVLLGQTASVGLLLWLGYQTLRLRRITTPAAQQTPIRLGASERTRLTGASRPMAREYEFVEDGVEDAINQDSYPERPVLIKPEANEFAPKMVVPAAMPVANAAAEKATEPPPPEEPVVSPSPTPKKPNPLEAAGIFIGWLKDIVTPKKQPAKPMIELPPRPPSIPNVDSVPAPVDASDPGAIAPADKSAADKSATTASAPSPALSAQETAVTNDKAAEADAKTEPTPAIPDSEDSNWPDDEFWD